MLFHPSKILTCLLAVGAPVYAQQSTSARVIKVGGALLKQSAEGLAIEFRGGRQANTSADDSQAVARPVAVESEQPRNFPRGAVDSATELAIIDRNRDNAIQVAERRVEFAREKMAQFAEYNRWTPPNDQPPMATRMLPHSTSYSPVSVTAPVQNFVPRSTFAHVLMAAERELKDSELQLGALVAERKSSAANQTSVDAGRTNGEVTTNANVPNRELRAAEVEASLRRERFMAESAELRLVQLSNMSELTYSGMYKNLYQKLELKRLEHELAAQSLEAEQEFLESDTGSR